jgi:hypothetical protein
LILVLRTWPLMGHHELYEQYELFLRMLGTLRPQSRTARLGQAPTPQNMAPGGPFYRQREVSVALGQPGNGQLRRMATAASPG